MNLENLFNKKTDAEVSEQVKDLLQNKVILITGAAGSIGSEQFWSPKPWTKQDSAWCRIDRVPAPCGRF